MHQLFRVVIADIVDPGAGTPDPACRHRPSGNTIDQPRYYPADVVDVGEIAAHLAMVEQLDRRAFEDRLGKQEIAMSGRPHGP